MAIALRYAARSDVGLVRSKNDDSGYAGPHLLVVADGMGGHAGGDVASSLAVGQLATLDGDAIGINEAQTRLARGLRETNTALQDRVRAQPELAGMGTTVTAILRAGSRLVLAHIGDSRAYLLRGGRLRQVTTDHTYVQSLVDAGRISAEEAENHPQRSVIMRVLTGEHGDEPDLSVSEGKAGDRWLLCSDGLSGFVSHETMEDTMAAGDDPGTTAQNLVRFAMRAGAPDNVTVIVADVVDLDRPPSTAPQIVGAAAARRRTGQAPQPPKDDSPASRAAVLGRDEAADEDDEDTPRWSLRGWVFWVVVLLLLAGLAGAVWGGWRWSQSQYFVGTSTDGSGTEVVTVFRGLPQDVGPIDLSYPEELTDVAVDDLPAFSRNRLADQIVVDSREGADAVVGGLRDQAVDGG